MPEVIAPNATSTPIRDGDKPRVLKEQGNQISSAQENLNWNLKKALKENSPNEQKKSKENVRRSKRNSPPTRRSNEKDEKKEEEKRLTAIDAMKIQENRRQRMMNQEVNDDEANTELAQPAAWSAKEDPIAEKKRIEAKIAKEKRIKAFLAEQEARKKNEVDKGNPAADALVQAPRRLRKKLFPNFFPKINYLYKPRAHFVNSYDLANFSKKTPVQMVPASDSKTSQASRPTSRSIIRYSMSQLRELNPYGYYFM